MKKRIAFALFVLSTISSYAQDIPTTIVKSDVFKDEYKYSQISDVTEDGNGGVLISRKYQGGFFSGGSSGYYFEHYDAKLKLIKEYEYELKYSEMEKQSSVLGIITNGNEVHLIDFLYNRQEKAYICSALTANINDFNFKKTELFRVKSEEIKQFSFFGSSSSSFDNDSWASMIVNEDKNAFAITLDIKDKLAETHKLFLYDNKLNKKIDHTFKREIKDKKFIYENIDVSKDGNTLYLLGKVYTDEKKSKKDGGKYQFELTRVTSDGEQTQAFDTEEHYSRSLKTIIFNDRLTCVGFYSDRKDNRYKGICYFEMDPQTLAVRKSKFTPFTEQFMIDKYGKDKDKELKNLSFRKMLIKTDGEIVLNAEEFYVTTTTVMTQNGSYTRTIYHYDDIVSAKLNTSGDIVWARNINKRQATQGDESYISYTSTLKGNDTYFFINTGEKVKKLSKDRIQFGQTSTKKSNLNVIRINENGDFDYKEILDDKENEVPFMVANGAITTDEHSVFFMGRKGKKKQILKVTL
jgi:hypothetical protein